MTRTSMSWFGKLTRIVLSIGFMMAYCTNLAGQEKQTQQTLKAESIPTDTAVSKKTDVVPKHSQADVIFEDNFDNGLSDKWQMVGLKQEDYRIRDGGLECCFRTGRL
jgi:hypothetical protein